MFYGEGAGNRRKLLKGELDKKMKDPRYKKAFDEYVSKVDTAKSVNKAKTERKARDTVKKVRTAVIPAAAFAGSIYYAKNKEKVDRAIINVMNRTMAEINRRKQYHDMNDFLKRSGFNFNA